MSLFAQQTPAAQPGGLFGNTNQQQNTTGGLFGHTNQQQQNTTGGLFGNQTQQQQNTTGGLFGNTNQQQNTTGSLFGNQTQQSTTTGGLFGNQTQQQNTTGGLFGAQPQQTNTTGGLFGSQPQQTNTTGGLFGSQPQQATTTGGLFGSAPQQQSSTGGLFGTQPQQSTGGLFGTQPQQQPSTGGLFGSAPQQQPTTGGLFNSAPAPVPIPLYNQMGMYSSKKDIDLYEIQILFQNFLHCSDPSNPANLFKYFCYTQVQEGENISYYQHYYPFVQSEEGVNCIDYNLWLKATQNNPNPKNTFPTQISSPKQMVSRLKTDEIKLLTVLEEFVNMQKQMELLNVKCNSEIEKELTNARANMKTIKTLLTEVSTKMAMLGIRLGRVDKNVVLEQKIQEKLIDIKAKTDKDSELMVKIDEVKNMAEGSVNEQEEKQYMKEMNKFRLDKNMNTLRELKIIIDKQFKRLTDNIKVVNGIQNDINHLNKYGTIK